MPRSIRAVIFDMDGVIVDSGAFHRRAWQTLLEEIGAPTADPEFWRLTIGRPVEEALPLLVNPSLSPREIARYARRKTDLYHEYARQGFAPVLGAQAFVRHLEALCVPRALASSASRRSVHTVLERLQLNQSFGAVVTSDDVRNGKPDPEVYLTAAQLIDVAPEQCVVFEDSEVGIQSAVSAGMTCVGVTTTQTDAELQNAGATRTIPDFNGLTWEKIVHR